MGLDLSRVTADLSGINASINPVTVNINLINDDIYFLRGGVEVENKMILTVKVDGLERLNGAIERAIEAVKIFNRRDKLAKAYLAGRLAGVRARQEIENRPPETDYRYPEDCDPGMVLKDRLKQVAALRR